jgi:hypothetical protein
VTNTGDQTYAIDAANRAAADTSQAYFKGLQANARTARAYGGDLNKMLMAQEDNSVNFALAQATAMDKAKATARELNMKATAGAIDQFGKNYALADNSTRLGLQTAAEGMKMKAAPAQFGLQAAQIQSGIAGNVGSLYSGAGGVGNSMLGNTTSSMNAALSAGNDLTRMQFGNAANLGQAAAYNNAGFGQFVGQNMRQFGTPVQDWFRGSSAIPTSGGMDDNLM